MEYEAKFTAPFGVLGIRCNAHALIGIDWLPLSDSPQCATTALAKEVCEQLLGYFKNPDMRFSIPMNPVGTFHQKKVWQCLCEIPRGATRNYGDLARELHSAPQAVGQACGANPIPIIIPCHRIVGKAGLGGFAHHRNGNFIDIKRWLLEHEGAL